MGMGSVVSPGVYTTEQDFSAYIPALSTTQFGIVTTASKGPMDTRTSISSEEQLVNTFGVPSVTHIGLHAARQYLRQGKMLTVVRVGSYSAATATQCSATDGTGTGQSDKVVFTPSSSGTWANGSSGLVIVVSDGSETDTYKIQVYWRGYLVEKFDSVVLTPTTSTDFIDTRMADSAFVTAETVEGQTTLTNGSIYFTGGDDGEVVTSNDIIGSVIGTTKTGLQLFASAEEVDLNLIAVPGNSNREVIAELISLCESRQDCMALIDPPFGLGVDDIISWHNGTLTGDDDYPTSALNSSYASLSWPWLQIYDGWTDANIYAPPSGFVACQMALTDRDYETWFAAAGFKRGRIVSALGLEYSPVFGDRERLYGGRAGTTGVNAVNPFVNFTGQGITRWGQRTLQRSPTALDRENVRRMLLYLRKVIATACYYMVFEQNDYRLWTSFKQMVIPYLRSVKAREGLRDYLVIMDETTNTSDVIERGECVGRILLKPTKTAEVINLFFTLVPQGASFSEFVTTG